MCKLSICGTFCVRYFVAFSVCQLQLVSFLSFVMVVTLRMLNLPRGTSAQFQILCMTFVSEMTYYVSSRTLNPHTLAHSLLYDLLQL